MWFRKYLGDWQSLGGFWEGDPPRHPTEMFRHPTIEASLAAPRPAKVEATRGAVLIGDYFLVYYTDHK